MKRSYCSIVLISLSLGSALGLSACSGFHLRGADSVTLVPLKGQSIVISGLATESAFQKALEAAILNSGGELRPTKALATVQLELTRFVQDKTVSAYSTARQVREFNHFVEVSFKASQLPTTTEKAPLEATIRTERIQVYDGNYVLGLAEEEQAIQAELRAEAARLVALRLQALQN